MRSPKQRLRVPRLGLAIILVTISVMLCARFFNLYGQEKSGFPNGFDAVQAAPASHKLIFENAFVRVVHVTLPPAGSSEPMHYHQWPSIFFGYNTGGKSAHLRYHTPDGKARDIPSESEPVHAGVWESGGWMRPEPMHSIEVVENAVPGPGAPPGWLRVEIKCIPNSASEKMQGAGN